MPTPDLHTPCVRHLAWACFGPTLFASLPAAQSQPRLTTQRMAWLQALDRQPAALQAWLAGQANRRLGHYFEALWAFFLTQQPAYRLLARGLPVREHGRTLGELDLLYRDRHGSVLHVECAVKYYLLAPGQGGDALADWLGPSVNDTLARKLTHLLERQLPLSRSPAAIQQLEALGIREPHPRLALKGQLFPRFSQQARLPAGVRKETLAGGWLPLAELPGLLKPGSHWCLPEPQDWLGPVRYPSALPARTLQRQLEPAIVESGRARLVTGMRPRADGSWEEVARYFIVPDDWPARAESARLSGYT